MIPHLIFSKLILKYFECMNHNFFIKSRKGSKVLLKKKNKEVPLKKREKGKRKKSGSKDKQSQS